MADSSRDSSRPPTVLVVEDHALVGVALTLALRHHGLDAHRCETGLKESVQEAAAALTTSVALVDLHLGFGPSGEVLSGAKLVPLLVADGWRVVILTGGSDEAAIAASLAAGAVGWLSKRAPFEELVTAVLDAVAGKPIISETERLRLLRLLHAQQAKDQAREAVLALLTPREREVLRALADGKRPSVIAEEAVVSLATVRAQVRSILAKLEVGSQLEAVAVLRRLQR